MNLIKNDLRSRLLLETLDDLMFVSCHGPNDIHEFDPLPAITRWKSQKNRRFIQDDNNDF